MTPAPAAAPRERVAGEDVEQAERRLWIGIKHALLIELVLGAGVLGGFLLVAYWPAP